MPTVELHCGDCLDVLRTLPDASVDAVVQDPPGAIRFMNRTWDHDRGGRDVWVPWLAARLAECLRVAKPGSRLLCWAIPRTSHWTGLAIEDAGWKIEDRVAHLFGQGFPKHKSKLKPACEDWWLAIKPTKGAVPLNIDECRISCDDKARFPAGVVSRTEAVYGAGEGRYGSRPRPADPSPAGRWPANVCLSHSPGCRRVGMKRVKTGTAYEPAPKPMERSIYGETNTLGRECGYADPDGLETVDAWKCEPDCAVRLLDEQSGERKSNSGKPFKRNADKTRHSYGAFEGRREEVGYYGDSGGASRGASRFFYCSKASRADRGPDNTHPTVKSTDLMRWLLRLIAKPGETVLDAFMGSGSTGKAAVLEGMDFIGIDGEAEHVAVARRRIDEALADMPLLAGTGS